ncbi:Piso0_000174 [Millerozyma farinosa CBS 7064]|uniref:Metacaspase-1 n=1 Tax=Pichia sorbitophila (strain ATCC MYA-4447 / BCRC 22081 / CBS 7064 / NBRC 10061 / NRRL Y-12695) TaxID=559304 RepID=G8YTA2_PICSO|nr:Piso0_000174 [Millerozyma farinosa CBS 7064]
MFPGAGRNSYNNYGPPQGPPPGQYYGAPQGSPPMPPPQQYGPPQGPPPGQYYGPPQGAPPVQYHSQASGGEYGGSSKGAGGSYGRPGMMTPPSTPQSFGQNSGFTFQYSNCQGRRKALLVGINYFGSKNELRGCINDVKNMSSFLNKQFGYSYDDMVILTDDQREMARVPTKDNILRAMQWLVKDARPNDSLVFHYSGHGGVTKDLDGDEESGFDDVIYPVDFEINGHIVDDWMHDIMVKPLPPGCRLTALYDSCHSGTALDLPYVYSTKGVVKEPNLWKDAGTGALNAFMSYESGNVGGAISSITGLVKKISNSNSTNREQVAAMKASPADIISISGCKDDQTSADARENGRSTGAMSWSFIQVLSQQPSQSYLSLLNNMRGLLASKYSQKPQLSSSHPQDMNLQFIM